MAIWAGLASVTRQGGDGVDDFGVTLAGLAVGDRAGQLQHLHGAGEPDSLSDLGSFEYAFGGAAVIVLDAGVEDRDLFPRQVV